MNFRPFEVSSKRRKGFNSETSVKRGVRIVHGDKELVEKLGRNDLCPCGSDRRFQQVLPEIRPLSMGQTGMNIPETDSSGISGPPRYGRAVRHAAPEPG